MSLRLQPERRRQRCRRDRPQPSSRPRRISISASSVDHSRSAYSAGAAIGGSSRRSGQSAWNCGKRSAAIHSVACGARQLRHALVARQLGKPVVPARLRAASSAVRNPSQTSASCNSSALAGSGQASAADAGDRLGIEPADIGRGLRRQPAPAHHRLGPALLQRRVVEIGVGPRRQAPRARAARARSDRGRRRRCRPTSSRVSSRSSPSMSIASCEAVGDRLADQRMVGDLALADQVLGAGELVGEDRGDQVLGVHARELRRHLLAAAEARQCQRHARDPAPARDEHRRVEQRLDQHLPDAGRMQIARAPRRDRSCAPWSATARYCPRSPPPAARS